MTLDHRTLHNEVGDTSMREVMQITTADTSLLNTYADIIGVAKLRDRAFLESGVSCGVQDEGFVLDSR